MTHFTDGKSKMRSECFHNEPFKLKKVTGLHQEKISQSNKINGYRPASKNGSNTISGEIKDEYFKAKAHFRM